MSDETLESPLDVAGRMLMKSRDRAVVQWDQMLAGKRQYGPWERIRERRPDLDAAQIEVIREIVPHVIDTAMYCFLSELDASDFVRLVVEEGGTMHDVAHESSGLPAEPCGERGWLARFAKQRYEEPD